MINYKIVKGDAYFTIKGGIISMFSKEELNDLSEPL